jgi:hypothetical protein
MTTSGNDGERPAKNRKTRLSRREMLVGAGVLGAVAPFGFLGGANALTGLGSRPVSNPLGDSLICRAAAPGADAASQGTPEAFAFAALSILSSASPVPNTAPGWKHG